MFFTQLGRIVAILALVVGIGMIASGFLIANEALGPSEVALKKYFPSKSSSGQVIDRGIYIAIFAIALGILTEIRYALRPPS